MFRTPSRLSLLTAAALVLLVPSLLDAGLFRGRCAVVPCPPPPECAPVPPEVAIRAVLDAQVAAWNKGDLDGFMRGYWKSPDLSFFSVDPEKPGGTRTRGWQATMDRYQKKYRAEGKEMGTLAFSELEIDVLGPDSAVVRGRFRLKMKEKEPTGLFTLVFRRFPEGWRIVHDHTAG